ncbi:MAG: c-type cytochrome [Halothiobacillaceae bacterium]
MKTVFTGFLTPLVAAVALTLPAAPAFSDPAEDAIDYRQSVFNVAGWNFKKLGAMVKGEIDYDPAEFAAMAELVASMSRIAGEGFIPNSDSMFGETRAKDEVWSDREKFDEYLVDWQEASDQLVIAAGGGDMKQIRATFKQTADSCKACHDDFRTKR